MHSVFFFAGITNRTRSVIGSHMLRFVLNIFVHSVTFKVSRFVFKLHNSLCVLPPSKFLKYFLFLIFTAGCGFYALQETSVFCNKDKRQYLTL